MAITRNNVPLSATGEFDVLMKNGGSEFGRSYTVSEAKNEIKKGIRAYYVKDKEGNYIIDMVNRLPFYLEGAPGIGKTEIVRQIATELGIGFVSFSVTHHTRNSMIGLPVIRDLENGDKYTEYTMSEIIASVVREQEKGYGQGILLLDEFNCVSETIMPIMLAFLQTRNIGLYRLPEDWVIVLCGNPTEYNNQAKKFTPAILDRVRKLDIEPDGDCFLQYAQEKGFNSLVVNFLKMNGSDLYNVKIEKNSSEVVTVRGWENLSRTIDAYVATGEKLSYKTVLQFIKSPDIATRFYKYYWLNANSFTETEMMEILDGNYSESLIERFNQNDRAFLNSAVEIIEKGLLGNLVYDLPRRNTKRISNVFNFLDRVNNGNSAKEKLFYFITENEGLLDVVRKCKNPEYLAVAKKMYGITA